MSIPDKKDLLTTIQNVNGNVHRTPVLVSRQLDSLYGNTLFFKCENFQRGGSFKIRGAVNAIAHLNAKERSAGVITHSSGNFAQALSLAAQQLNVPAYIIMPENAPKVKVEAVKTYGGSIYFSGNTIQDREELTTKIQKETGATFIHPSDNTNVLMGQGTAVYEMLEQSDKLDAVFTPVGGGGLIAGCSLMMFYFGEGKCYGGEPEHAADARESLHSGEIVKPERTDTIADGLRTYLGQYNFPIIKEHVEDIFLVSESDIIESMKDIYQRLKIVIEPSSAVALAAVRKSGLTDKKIGVVLSGGNVDLSALPFS